MPRRPDSSSGIRFVIREGPKPPEQDHRPQPVNFEFVHGKDRESRTRVRRHVMQGWRRNKKQQFNSDVQRTRGQWATKELAPQDADTPGVSSGESPPQLVWYGFGDAASSLEDSDADWDLEDPSFPIWYPESSCVAGSDGLDYGQTENDPTLRNIGAGWRTDSRGYITSKPDDREHSVTGSSKSTLSSSKFKS